jgi:hypothetical protein
MEKKQIEKQILSIDSNSTTGDLFYGYTNEKEVIKELKKMDDSPIDKDLLSKVRVMQYEKDGEPWYCWNATCPCCGSENRGVWSFFYGE